MVMKSGKWKLCGAQIRRQEWRDCSPSLLIMVAGAKPVLCMRSQLFGNPMQTRGVEATQKWQPRDSILAQFRHYHPC